MTAQEPSIPLDSYATVMAALGAGLTLDRALSIAELDRTVWADASEQWQDAIEESAATDAAVLVAFDAALLNAKRRYAPVIEPIQTDAKAWAHFRRHFVTALDAPAFLAERGLSLLDYARLEAEWANRAFADEAMAAAIQKHLEEPLGDCPALTVVPSPLLTEAAEAKSANGAASDEPVETDPEPRRFVQPSMPFAQSSHHQPAPRPFEQTTPLDDTLDAPDTLDPPVSRAAKSTPFRSPSERPVKTAELPPVALERYAVMLADATVFHLDPVRVCEKHGITEPLRAQAFAYWQPRVAADRALQERVDVVIARYRSIHAKSGSQAPRLPVGATTTGPLDLPDLRKQSPLPFQPPRPTSDFPPAAPSPSPPPPTPAIGNTTLVADGSAAKDLPFAIPELEGIPFDTFVCVVAELETFPDRRDEIAARHGFRDAAHLERVRAAGKKAVVEKNLTGRFMRLFTRHVDKLRQG